MTNLTVEAKALLDRYVGRARLSLRGTGVEADEIENDIRAHVDEALSGRDEEVGAADVHEVLERLGSPDQWVADDEVPIWRRIYRALTSGPEDWRLAYLCFGLTVVGLITIPVGGIVLVAGAVFLARAVIDLNAERGEALGARRWLIYPPLVLVTAAVVAAAVLGPVGGFAAIATESYGGHPDLAMLGIPAAAGPLVSLVILASGLWWVVLAVVAALAAKPIRWLLVPIGNSFRPKHSWWLGGVGAALAAGAAVALVIII